MLVDLFRLLAPFSAAMFVLITITNSFLESPLAGSFTSRHPCRVVNFEYGHPPISQLALYGCQPTVSLRHDTCLIGLFPEKLEPDVYLFHTLGMAPLFSASKVCAERSRLPIKRTSESKNKTARAARTPPGYVTESVTSRLIAGVSAPIAGFDSPGPASTCLPGREFDISRSSCFPGPHPRR